MTLPTPSRVPKPARWGHVFGWLSAAVLVAGVVYLFAPKIDRFQPSDMCAECVETVATWAGVDSNYVVGRDVSAENMTSEGWDFRGTYPGGEWACGGPEGEGLPAQVMAYPDGGLARQLR